MSKTTIPKGGITADAIDATLVADDAISDEHLDVTAVTGQTAITSLADTDKFLVSDASDSGNLKYVENQYLGGGGLVPISYTNVTSTVNTIEMSNVFTSTYKNYFVMGYNLRPGVDNVRGMMHFKTSGGVLSGDLYDFAATGQQSGSSGDATFANDTSAIELTAAINQNSTAGGFNFYGYFFTPLDTSLLSFNILPYFSGQVSYANNSGHHCVRNLSVRYDNSTPDAVTGFRLFTTGSTSYYDRGTVSVYGIKDS